jgi:sporulation protein YlmC with PRC-barrel domain
VKLSELLGLSVRTESGGSLGRVHDLRGELTPRTLKVTGLVVGRLGLLERLGLGAPTSAARLRTRDVIPWSDVIRADRRGIVVRDRAKPEEPATTAS